MQPKLRLLTVLLCVFFTSLNVSADTKIDSLYSIWENETHEPTTRMRALYDMALAGYLYSQPDSARYFGEVLLAAAHEHQNHEYEADALALIGSSYYLQGRFNKAIEFYSKYGEVSEQHKFQKRWIKSKVNTGLSLGQLAQFDEALELLEEGLGLLRNSTDTLETAKCLNNIGLMYLNRGKYPEALAYFEESLPLLRSHGDTRLLAYSLGNIASVQASLGNSKEALATFKTILKTHLEQNDLHGAITAHNSISGIEFSMGNILEALEHQQQTVLLSKQLGDQEGLTLALVKIADSYSKFYVPDSALHYINQAIEIRQNLEDISGLASAYLRKGEIYLKQEEYDQALHWAIKSEELYQSIKNDNGMADAITKQAQIHRELGNIDTAEKLFTTAAPMFRKSGNSVGLASMLVGLGQVYYELGKTAAAAQYAEEALILAKNTDDITLLSNTYFLQYQLAKKGKNAGKALAYFEQHKSLKDSVLNDQNYRQVLSHQLKFEYSQKQLKRDTEQVKKDAEHTIAIEKQRQYIYGLSGVGVLFIFFTAGGFFFYRQRQRNKSLSESIAARDYERNRLSRELHDGVANELYGIQMAIDGNQYTGKLDSLNKEIHRIRNEVRHISHDLAMPDIQHTSLPEMSRYLVERWQHTGRKVSIDIQPDDDGVWKMRHDKATHLYRILQEGLTNALRYSREDRDVRILLKINNNNVLLQITNHYIETLVGESTPGIGLKNLQERAELIGGTANVKMTDGHAILSVSVPTK